MGSFNMTIPCGSGKLTLGLVSALVGHMLSDLSDIRDATKNSIKKSQLN